MIKKIIMNWVRNYIDEEISKKASLLFEAINLKEKKDSEIIFKYKHLKFKEISDFERYILENRYNIKIVKYHTSDFFWLQQGIMPFDEDDYISDSIELLLKPEKEEKIKIKIDNPFKKTVKKTKKTKKEQKQ